MPKILKEGTLWDFSTSILSQNFKKMKWGTFKKKFPEKKSRNAEKTQRGNLWPRPVLYVTRETLLVQFLGLTGRIWPLVKTL